jgi:putative ABC transport system permease protein
MSEIFFSFMVIFAVFTLLVFYYQNYKKPMGFDYENVWQVNYDNTSSTSNTDSLALFYGALTQTIKSMPTIKELSFCSDNIPFSQNTNQGAVNYGGKKTAGVNWFTVDEGYKSVLNLKILEGRWFTKGDAFANEKPVLINKNLKEFLFGNESTVGKIIFGDFDQKNKMKVIGVTEDMKIKGDYAESGFAIYYLTDTGSFHWLNRILVSVAPDANAAFEGRLYKTLANMMKNSNVEIEHLTDNRKNTNYFALVPMIIAIIVACFLMINVALGLFGVLWYNINKRRGEIGLRRAVGATGKSVSGQLVSEALILATLSVIVGSFFAIQFPLLNVFDLSASVYIKAMVLAILFIYLLVVVCSVYPGKQAAAIYPAVALHEE